MEEKEHRISFQESERHDIEQSCVDWVDMAMKHMHTKIGCRQCIKKRSWSKMATGYEIR